MAESTLITGQLTALPGYRVRESLKAKHVSLRMTVQGGLEVIVPKGFDQSRIPEILHTKQSWIAKTTDRLEEQRQQLSLEASHELPDRLQLRAIDQRWQVEYQPTQSNRVTLTEKDKSRLILRGCTQNEDACKSLLQQWLSHKAYQRLVPWLWLVSQELNLPFNKASVRGQKTLWASCSQQKNISLNYKLLFLPTHLVRYVLIHELCHTIHLNHSSQFWGLVFEKESDYKALDRELRKSSHYVPSWLEPSILDKDEDQI
ncbi:MAG: M48 family metallopeptidase [Candidatus Parcubacteria bacterium]|nr:M48 family metallopeptidase [Leptolyngbyaceae cyanobacterium LF-bin-113]